MRVVAGLRFIIASLISVGARRPSPASPGAASGVPRACAVLEVRGDALAACSAPRGSASRRSRTPGRSRSGEGCSSWSRAGRAWLQAEDFERRALGLRPLRPSSFRSVP
eukprot:1002210-Alexandrium_andersonii.AAC.1